MKQLDITLDERESDQESINESIEEIKEEKLDSPKIEVKESPRKVKESPKKVKIALKAEVKVLGESVFVSSISDCEWD